jgi:hypothetical protein
MTPHMAILEHWRGDTLLAPIPIVFNRNHPSTDEDGVQTKLPVAILYYLGDLSRERTSSGARIIASQYRLRIIAEDLDEAIDIAEIAEPRIEKMDARTDWGAIVDAKCTGEMHEPKPEGSWAVNLEWTIRRVWSPL